MAKKTKTGAEPGTIEAEVQAFMLDAARQFEKIRRQAVKLLRALEASEGCKLAEQGDDDQANDHLAFILAGSLSCDLIDDNAGAAIRTLRRDAKLTAAGVRADNAQRRAERAGPAAPVLDAQIH